MTSKIVVKRSIFLIFLPALLVAVIFQIVHLPALLQDNRPSFVALVLIYFSTLDSKVINVEIAFCAGALLDFMVGAPLGLNAMLLAAQVYIINSQFRNFAIFTWWQQAIIIGVVHLVVRIIGFWVEHIVGQNHYEMSFLVPSAIMIVLWPVVSSVCAILCHAFGVIVRARE